MVAHIAVKINSNTEIDADHADVSMRAIPQRIRKLTKDG